MIDNHLNWIALPKDTFVVQLGDQVDGGGRGGKETHGEMKLIEFMESIKNNPSLLENLTYESKGKTRKISKTSIESIKKYLFNME